MPEDPIWERLFGLHQVMLLKLAEPRSAQAKNPFFTAGGCDMCRMGL